MKHRTRPRHRTPTLSLLLCALVFTGCGPSSEPVQIRLDRRVDVASVRPGDGDQFATATPLGVAIASILSPSKTLDGYHDLLDYMGKRLGRPIRLAQRATYVEVNDLLKNREIDLAFVCAGALLEGERQFGMQVLVVPEMRGQTVYYSYLIVNAASRIERLDQLRGKSFAFSDPLSNSGRLAPLYQLAIRKETPDRFFSRSVFTGSHDNSILAVADRLVDAAAVDSLVYDYLRARQPDTVASTRVIERWGPYGIPPVVVHPALDPALRATLKEFLLTIHRDPDGKRLLERLLIDRFVELDPDLYRSIREMDMVVRRR